MCVRSSAVSAEALVGVDPRGGAMRGDDRRVQA
jgi:hypothetical protein